MKKIATAYHIGREGKPLPLPENGRPPRIQRIAHGLGSKAAAREKAYMQDFLYERLRPVRESREVSEGVNRQALSIIEVVQELENASSEVNRSVSIGAHTLDREAGTAIWSGMAAISNSTLQDTDPQRNWTSVAGSLGQIRVLDRGRVVDVPVHNISITANVPTTIADSDDYGGISYGPYEAASTRVVVNTRSPEDTMRRMSDSRSGARYRASAPSLPHELRFDIGVDGSVSNLVMDGFNPYREPGQVSVTHDAVEGLFNTTLNAVNQTANVYTALRSLGESPS